MVDILKEKKSDDNTIGGYTSGGGNINLEKKSNSWPSNTIPQNDDDIDVTKNQFEERNPEDRYGIENLGEDGESGYTTMFDSSDDMPKNSGDDRITEGAPPPPQIPDIPIKSTWGIALTIMAILTYIITKRKL